MELTQSIKTIKGIGEKRCSAFKKIGIESVYDLISYFPYRYEDRTSITPIDNLKENMTTCIDVVIANNPTLSRIRNGLTIVKFRVVDESGSLDISYFNQPYIKNQLQKGDHCIFYGKIQINKNKFVLYNPVMEHIDSHHNKTGAIVPIYHSTSGLTQTNIKNSINAALDQRFNFDEIIPQDIINRYKLLPVNDAYEQIHRPVDLSSLHQAQERFIFEELFSLCVGFQYLKKTNNRNSNHRFDIDSLDEFYSILPFQLTNAQISAINDIKKDLSSGSVMNRLIQGDVGSGKTIVAAAAVWLCWKNKSQSAFMVPTEILAEQHYNNLKKIFESFDISIALLTGSQSNKEKNEIKQKLYSGEIDLIIGTHALFSTDVEFNNLGLVITDEQHRFGVKQRDKLVMKGSDAHVMVMSATPIPRTLALMIYGDLDVSIINELPPHRKAIKTYAVNSSYHERIYKFIQKIIQEYHQQVYVVCAAIEDSEDSELLSVNEQVNILKQNIPSAKIEALHGKMDEKTRNEIMSEFSKGNIDILVSTTVIEVGVDVPNASLIIIEDADRFGLSQLHQLRGRVGRSDAQGHCILVSNSSSEIAIERLRTMTETQNGYKIAEKDLEIRGPGNFFGSEQHGLPPIRIADLCSDIRVLNDAQKEAIELISNDPFLQHDDHRILRDYIENRIIIKRIN